VGTPVSGGVSVPRDASPGSGPLRPATGPSMRAPTEVNPEPQPTGPTRPLFLTRGRGVLLLAVGVGALLAGAVAVVLRPSGHDLPPSAPVAANTLPSTGVPAAMTSAPGAHGAVPSAGGAATGGVPGTAPAGTSVEGTVVPSTGVATAVQGATAEGTVIPPAGATGQAPAEPTEVELQVTVTPRKAWLRLDDRPLEGNPFSDTFPRDGLVHTLRVSAPGYTTVVKELRLDRDLALDITLSRRGQESSRPAVVETPAREPAQVQPREPDFAELPAKPARRKPPRRTLDPDNPWAEQGGTSSSETP
jgi:hypothetical protein